MKSVVFTFGEQASEADQDQTGREIAALPGVHNVGRISPAAKKPTVRRMWFAEVADDAAAELVERLRQRDDIKDADLPAPRHLV